MFVSFIAVISKVACVARLSYAATRIACRRGYTQWVRIGQATVYASGCLPTPTSQRNTAVTALSDYLNDHIPASWRKPQVVDALHGVVDRATVYRYLAGNHPRNPPELVLQAFADALPGVSVSELRAAAQLPPGVNEPWIPPAEANRLSLAQRRALDAFIKATVAAVTADESAEETLEAPEPALTAVERQQAEEYIEHLRRRGRGVLADAVAAETLGLPVPAAVHSMAVEESLPGHHSRNRR